MTKLKITTEKLTKSIENIREIMSKRYNLIVKDYEIIASPNGEERIINIYNEDKVIDTVISVLTDTEGYEAYLTLYPPLNSAFHESFEYIMEKISNRGICLNIDYDLIRSLYDRYLNGEIIIQSVIATGTKSVNGRDSELILHFDRVDPRPKIFPDGRVDYKTVESFVVIEKGDILLTKKPATEGRSGVTVFDTESQPVIGKDFDVIMGEGVTVNETGMVYSATDNGYVDFHLNKISVIPTYVVKNVDYTTGNIKFNGNVHIKGDVLPGFKVNAAKSIIVDGICQDCELIAGGNIILRTGIKSTGEGLLKSERNIVVGYGENTKIYAKRSIVIKKYAYNCELYSGTVIEAMSNDGIIAGGIVKAFSEISVKQLGNKGNSKFSVIVGSKYFAEKDLAKLRSEKNKLSDTIEQIGFALSRFDLTNEDVISHPKVKRLLDLRTSFNTLVQDIDEKEAKLIASNKPKSIKIKIRDVVMDGVTIIFNKSSTVVREPMSKVIFYYDYKYSEIAWVSMKDALVIDTDDTE